MKQQAGVGILLAFTTAICWGALLIVMKQVLEVMELPTIALHRFLMASIGLGAILAARKRLSPLHVLRRPRWLILLAVTTARLSGDFTLFSSSSQYLNPTVSQVIGRLSPIGTVVASIFILKEKIHNTQVVEALMLPSDLVMSFNTSLVEISTKFANYAQGVISGVGAATIRVGYGVAQKVLLHRLALPQILPLLYTLCIIAFFPLARPGVIAQLNHWQLACSIFCGLNTLVGYGILAEAMVRWQAAQVNAIITLVLLSTLFFSDPLSLTQSDLFIGPTLNLSGYLGVSVVIAGAIYSAIGHRTQGGLRKHTTVVSQPRAGE